MSDGIGLKVEVHHYISERGDIELTFELRACLDGQYGNFRTLSTSIVTIDGQEWMRKIAANRLKGE